MMQVRLTPTMGKRLIGKGMVVHPAINAVSTLGIGSFLLCYPDKTFDILAFVFAGQDTAKQTLDAIKSSGALEGCPVHRRAGCQGKGSHS